MQNDPDFIKIPKFHKMICTIFKKTTGALLPLAAPNRMKVTKSDENDDFSLGLPILAAL